MTNLDQINQSLAKSRKKAMMTTLITYGIMAVLFFTLLSRVFTSMNSFNHFNPASIFVFFIIFAGAVFISSIVSSRAKNAYATQVKSILSDSLFKSHFENYRFSPDEGFDYATIRELSILPTGDRFHSNDLMRGTLHNVNFSRADVLTTTTTTDSKGNSHTTTNFRGQVYAFDFFKNSNSYLRIRDRSFSKFGRGAKVDNAKQIKFEDSLFNEMFRCYSNNDHEAFYLFTPHFMQKVIDFRRKLDHQFSLIIHNSMLYIAVYTNTDSFEPSIWRDIDQAYLSEVQKDLDIITTIIDDLDLKNTLFK